MIKGVNRRIVEITGMENDYFEKAVLYVRPEKFEAPQTMIELEARTAVYGIMPEIKEAGKIRSIKDLIISPMTIRLVSAAVILMSVAVILYLFMG